MDVTVPDGSHVTHLSADESESLEIAAEFILEGLQTGETVCIVAAEAQAGLIMNILKESTPRLERFSASGKLHLSQGIDSPEHQTQYLQALAAHADGRFRVSGDMSCTFKKGWSTVEAASAAAAQSGIKKENPITRYRPRRKMGED